MNLQPCNKQCAKSGTCNQCEDSSINFEDTFEICVLVEELISEDTEFHDKARKYELAEDIYRMFKQTYSLDSWDDLEWSEVLEEFTRDKYNFLTKNRYK
jgi:hypothetical protein